MPDFLLRALIAGLGVALVAGPLGSFVVWRRMAYFGDALAHAALLGVVLGVIAGIDVTLGIIASCLAAGLILLGLGRQRLLASDTLLGLVAHGGLSLGLVALAFMDNVRADLMGYLFGDVLSVTNVDLMWIYGGGGAALVALAVIWRPLLAVTVHRELAQVEGVNVAAVRLTFMLVIALVIAVAIKIVGIVLITSLLIIPAAAARRFAATPEQMAVLAALTGALAVAGGLAASFQWDTPTGPSIVLAAVILFAASLAIPRRLIGGGTR